MSEVKRNYGDRSQVAPYWEAYLRRLAELTERGRYPYNDDFKGHIGAPAADEDFLIYMCQEERSLRDMEAKVAERIAAGYVRPEEIADGTRCEAIAEFAFYSGGSGFREFRDARLVRHGGGLAVLPKGKRTRGHILNGSVLVKVAS